MSLIGKSLKRLDTPDKVNGKAVYGIDAMLPGMKFATLAQCPVFGGKVGTVDDSAAKKIPGVRKIVVLDDLVAVVGDHMWAAKQGPRGAQDRLERGRRTPRSIESDIWRESARRQRKGRRGRQEQSATSPRAWPPAKGSRRPTKCRSWRMRRWSR